MFTRDPNELPFEAFKNIPMREFRVADAMFEQITERGSETTQIYIHNNLSSNYRAPEEERLLFVNCEGRSLRPQEDGLSVRWDESKGENQISGTQNGDQSAALAKSFHLGSQHPLCLPCRDLLDDFCQYHQVTKEDAGAADNVVTWHHCISSLVISVQCQDCFICKIILDTYLGMSYPSLLKNASGLANFRLEVCWDRSENARGMKNLYFAAINKSKPKHTSSNYFFLGVMCAWPEDVSAFVSESQSLPLAASNSTPGGEDKRRKQLASAWVEQCITNESDEHNACAAGDDDDFVPTRVLDVEIAVRHGKLRLIKLDDEDSRPAPGSKYCTLSHCWGKHGSQIIPLLLKNNIDYRSSAGIAMEDLPPAFREAIIVCNWFQVKYLWIDSLCIIQDSKEDWQKEAGLMSSIYKKAWLNISADAGENSQVGLFRETSILDRTWPKFFSERSDSSWTLTPSPDYFLSRIRRAPSHSRAWIYRERQLSRRILKFTEHGMAWECCELGRPSYASESFPRGIPFEHFFLSENKYQIGRLEQELVPGDEETYARWNDICEVLSTKSLTYESDRWLIISTMAEDFSRLLPNDTYLAGLWGSTLPHSLLWYHEHPRGKPTVSWHELGPSWSWLSGRHPVTLAHRAHVKRHAVVADLIYGVASLASPDSPSLPPDPFGRVKEGALSIQGYIRSIRLILEPEGQTWKLYVLEENLQSKDGHARDTEASTQSVTKHMRKLFRRSKNEDGHSGSSKQPEESKTQKAWRYIGDSWDSHEGDHFQINPDWRDIPVPYDCFVFFVTLDQALYSKGGGTSQRQLECLILEEAAKGDNVFNRYGRLLLHDRLAVKMRYQVGSREHFNSFQGVDENGRVGETPGDYIAQTQLGHVRERGDDRDYGNAQMQGTEGLYQFDGDVQRAFPWLVKLEPSVIEIV